MARESVITLPLLKKLVYIYGGHCICVMKNVDTDTTGWDAIVAIFALIHAQFIKELSAAVIRGQEKALLSGYSVETGALVMALSQCRDRNIIELAATVSGPPLRGVRYAIFFSYQISVLKNSETETNF